MWPGHGRARARGPGPGGRGPDRTGRPGAGRRPRRARAPPPWGRPPPPAHDTSRSVASTWPPGPTRSARCRPPRSRPPPPPSTPARRPGRGRRGGGRSRVEEAREGREAVHRLGGVVGRGGSRRLGLVHGLVGWVRRCRSIGCAGSVGPVRRSNGAGPWRQRQVLRGADVAVEHVGHLGPALLDQGGRGREVAVLARRLAAAAEDHHLDARRQRRQLADEAGVDGHEERGQRGLGRPPGRRGW